MRLPFIVGTYRLALPDSSEEQAALVVDAAIERARLKHPDWDRFEPAVEFLSRSLFTDHRALPLDDFLEVLYCAVKHADFAKAWRLSLKKPAVH